MFTLSISRVVTELSPACSVRWTAFLKRAGPYSLHLTENSLIDQPAIHQLVDHLFRHESGKLVAVLTRVFGSENLDLAEDVVQDSLAEALTQWQYRGVPDNPSGWLFRVARNKS